MLASTRYFMKWKLSFDTKSNKKDIGLDIEANGHFILLISHPDMLLRLHNDNSVQMKK